MIEILQDKTVKARKDHRCDLCGGLIRKGLTYNCQSNKLDGDVYTHKAHLKCTEMCKLLDLYRDADYGVDEEIFCDSVDEVFAGYYSAAFPDTQELREIYNLLTCVPTYEKTIYLYDKIKSGELK